MQRRCRTINTLLLSTRNIFSTQLTLSHCPYLPANQYPTTEKILIQTISIMIFHLSKIFLITAAFSAQIAFSAPCKLSSRRPNTYVIFWHFSGRSDGVCSRDVVVLTPRDASPMSGHQGPLPTPPYTKINTEVNPKRPTNPPPLVKDKGTPSPKADSPKTPEDPKPQGSSS